MKSLLIILFTLVGVVFFIIIKKTKSTTKKSSSSINSGLGIPMTKQEVELERQSNEEIMKLLEASITASGFFRSEKIPELIANIRGSSIPFGRIDTKLVFDDDAFLTIEEKKMLGLNTRMKYSKKFIECF